MQTYHEAYLKFLLEEVFPLHELYQKPFYAHLGKEEGEMILSAAKELAESRMYPLLREMDEKPPRMENGRIVVHPGMKDLMKLFGEGGWITMNASLEHGGQQLPVSLFQAVAFILASANYGITAYPLLTAGAAHLIESFGSEDLQKTYLSKMFGGEWQGTMALTEPQAGSSLSDVVTQAVRTDEGHYLIKGQKVFISCGDHDACENIVHLMLAKIPGGPAGVKGISLFVVPRLRPDGHGGLQFNDVSTAGCFHKMGYHGAPIAHLILGEQNDCRGYLVGEEHKGLSYMFQMMNEARIGVGQQACSIASAAYYYSLDYAKNRLQGRPVTQKQSSSAQIPIIEHADVRRMLLFQKSVVEGSLALILQASWYYDQWVTAEGEEKDKYFLLLEFLTPVVKSYPAEMSILTTSAGIQCLGGYGYTKEYLAELYFRETRIHTIHEGTTAIHGLDLLGRKVTMSQGKALLLLQEEIRRDMKEAAAAGVDAKLIQQLKDALQSYEAVMMHLMGVAASKGPLYYLSDATLFLEFIGILLISWQWLKVLAKAKKSSDRNMLTSAEAAAGYFYAYELPKLKSLEVRLKDSGFSVLEVSPEDIF